MIRKIPLLLCFLLTLSLLTACGTFTGTSSSDALNEMPGKPPITEDVQPKAITSENGLSYDSNLSLSDSFNQMNSLRLAICDDMYSAVVTFSDDSAWVPIAASKYTLGCDEFLAASFVMESDTGITAERLFREQGFRNIEITTLDVENSWKITARKDENNYEYTVRYGAQSDSYRFTLAINDAPSMLMASKRTTGGYAVQVWTPEGSYHILAEDVKEGRFGFIPKQRDARIAFPETDLFFDENFVTTEFTTKGAEYTFLLANNILYIAKDGSNYAVPLQ
ncbi:MAG: hypothetical protein IJO61_02835 [Oscillospiraceae bacterium]|nr:hypothetical protein [Oscillospiraceae bacterium]